MKHPVNRKIQNRQNIRYWKKGQMTSVSSFISQWHGWKRQHGFKQQKQESKNQKNQQELINLLHIKQKEVVTKITLAPHPLAGTADKSDNIFSGNNKIIGQSNPLINRKHDKSAPNMERDQRRNEILVFQPSI